MQLLGNGRRLVLGVAVAVAVITGASLVLRLLALERGVPAALAAGRPAVFPGFPLLLPLLDVDGEANLPSWFSSAVLLLTASLLWGVAVLARSTAAGWHRHWALLAVAFGYLSLDEMSQLHERLLIPLGAMAVDARGIFTFGWVVVALPVVVLFAVTFLRFLLALPRDVRLLVVTAGGLYVGGALGMELVGGWILDSGFAEASVPYVLVTSVEELLEMAGFSLFLSVVVRLQRRLRQTAAVPVRELTAV